MKDCQLDVSPVNYSDSDSDSDWGVAGGGGTQKSRRVQSVGAAGGQVGGWEPRIEVIVKFQKNK